MNPVADSDYNALDKKLLVDFNCFIQSAVQKNLSWSCLTIFLTDLATTLDESRQVIKILVQELEKWVTKEEISTSEKIAYDSSRKLTENFTNDQNSDFECDFRDEKNNDLIALTDDESKKSFKQTETKQKERENVDELPRNYKGYINEKHAMINTLCNSNVPNLMSKTRKKFRCTLCSKVFKRKGCLRRHEIIHTGLKQYKCNTCDVGFRHKVNLKSHEIIHTGEKPFHCKYCEKGFTRSFSLKKHERKHTGEKPYKCTACEKCFSNLDVLKYHGKTHSTISK